MFSRFLGQILMFQFGDVHYCQMSVASGQMSVASGQMLVA